jgi:GT2 family glycosyltransferase
VFIEQSDIDLSILVVSYNSRSETLACLASVLQYPPDCRFELIVLDNASPDASADAIAEAFPTVSLIRSQVNLGFAGGNNAAAAFARGRRLLLLNPDTLVNAASLTALWQFANACPDAKIWGGRTLFADGRLNPASCWAEITLWSLFCSTCALTWLAPRSVLLNPEAFGGWQRDTVRAVDIVSGCFLLIDHSLWRQLDGFDPRFFMYAEEADLCLRARRFGARPMVSPAATIIHLGGASEPSQVEKILKIHRGRITLMRKHWGRLKLTLGLALYWHWALLRMIGAHAISGPRDIPGQSRSKWQHIWRQRHIWLAGY